MSHVYPPDTKDWTEEDHAAYEEDMRKEGIDLGLPPLPEDEVKEIHVQDYTEVTLKDIETITQRLDIDPDPRATAARQRARRSHMVRKLKTRFRLFQPFTAAEAAVRCKMEEGEMRGFLEWEVTMPGSLFQRSGTHEFMITSPWIV